VSVEEDLDVAANSLAQWFRRERERIDREFSGLETPEDIVEREAEEAEALSLRHTRDTLIASVCVCGACDRVPGVVFEDAGIDGGPSPVMLKSARIVCECGLEMRAPAVYSDADYLLKKLAALVFRWNAVWKHSRENER